MWKLLWANVAVRRPGALSLGPDVVIQDNVTEHHFDLLSRKEPTGARCNSLGFRLCSVIRKMIGPRTMSAVTEGDCRTARQRGIHWGGADMVGLR